MILSSVPAFGRRMGEPAFTSSEIKVYPSNSAKLWRVGALGIGLGLLLGFLPLRAVLHWLSGGPMPSSDMFTAATCLLFIPLGLLSVLGALRGLQRLTVMPQGIKAEALFGTRWANWDSLEPFVLKTVHAGRLNKQVRSASARVTGSHASARLQRTKTFTLTDHFLEPIAALAAELNAARAGRRRRCVRARRGRSAGGIAHWPRRVQTALGYIRLADQPRCGLHGREHVSARARQGISSEHQDAVRNGCAQPYGGPVRRRMVSALHRAAPARELRAYCRQ